MLFFPNIYYLIWFFQPQDMILLLYRTEKKMEILITREALTSPWLNANSMAEGASYQYRYFCLELVSTMIIILTS